MASPPTPTHADTFPAPAVRTLCVGCLAEGEERVLAELAPASRLWKRAENLLQAQAVLGAEPIDRVLLAQPRPGVLPADTPARIRGWAPEAELLCLAGDWCEGELRTGKPWPDVPRAYWHQLPTRSLPNPPEGARPLVLACAASYDACRMWSEVLDALGFPSICVRRARPAPLVVGDAVAIWDGDQLDGREANLLGDFCRARRRTPAPVVAVFDYPRADVVACAQRLGVRTVLGRPWAIDVLERALLDAVAEQTQPVAAPAGQRRLAA